MGGLRDNMLRRDKDGNIIVVGVTSFTGYNPKKGISGPRIDINQARLAEHTDPAKVIFSYAGKDGIEAMRALRDLIIMNLKLTGDEVYFDAENLLGLPETYQDETGRVLNPNWKELYLKAMGEAKVVVFFVTDKWLVSPFCQEELQQCGQRKKEHLYVIGYQTEKVKEWLFTLDDVTKTDHVIVSDYGNDVSYEESLLGFPWDTLRRVVEFVDKHVTHDKPSYIERPVSVDRFDDDYYRETEADDDEPQMMFQEQSEEETEEKLDDENLNKKKNKPNPLQKSTSGPPLPAQRKPRGVAVRKQSLSTASRCAAAKNGKVRTFTGASKQGLEHALTCMHKTAAHRFMTLCEIYAPGTVKRPVILAPLDGPRTVANPDNTMHTKGQAKPSKPKVLPPIEQKVKEFELPSDCDSSEVLGISLEVGNTYRVLEQSVTGKNLLGVENNKEWTLAVNGLDLSEYIEKVVFLIHPSFRDHVIETLEEPFEVTRIGWGEFPCKIVVFFKPSTQRKPVIFDHDLDLHSAENESSSTHIV
eukprot:Colp12_sorted_trinity150504_noHs@33332